MVGVIMSSLTKSLNVYQGVGILVSTLLGSSIFIVPAMAASLAGEKSIIAWLLTLLCILPVAFTFSNLAALYPSEGGTAFFIRQAFNGQFERFTSWLFLAAMPIAPPIILITGVSYLGALWNLNEFQLFLAESFSLLALFIINRYGIHFMSKLNTFITLVTLAVLACLIGKAGLAGAFARPVDLSLSWSDLGIVVPAVSLIFWCFVGIEAVVHLAGSFKNVKRDFPLTILISIGIVGGLCILLGLIVLKYHAYGNPVLNANYMVFLFNILFGSAGKIFVAVMAFCTCLAAVNLYLVSFSKMLYAMSMTGALPECFQKLNKMSVPIPAMLLCYSIVFLTLLGRQLIGFQLEELILYANVIFMAVYLLASLAGVVLLSGLKRGMACLSTLLCSCLFISLGLKCIYVLLLCIGVMIIDYIWYHHQRMIQA